MAAPTLADLLDALETIAPLHAAEEWDNVGLLVGDASRADATPLDGPVLLTIDCTEAVAREAVEAGASVVVSYHPPLFRPVRRLDGSTARLRAVLLAAAHDMAIYSPHTALDAAPGGVADWLCDLLAPEHGSLGDRRALIASSEPSSAGEHKIVTFAPPDAVDTLRKALASIGAGRIGEYSLCSFNVRGLGTFQGSEKTSPAVGEAGRLETVEEVRLEMVCPAQALPLAVEMVRQFHPYEEPPIDLYPLAPRPSRSSGAGRRVTLDRPVAVEELALRLKERLGAATVKLAKASDAPAQRVGVCPGSGGGLLDAAIEQDCDCFVTGEMQHHQALTAVERGCSIILAGHTTTERGFLPHYAAMIRERLDGVETLVSRCDEPIFRAL